MKRNQLDTDHILHLLLKGLVDECDEKERGQLHAWLSESPENARVFEELQDKEHIRALGEDQQSYRVEQAYDRISRQLPQPKVPVWRTWMPYAAAVLVLALGISFWMARESFRPVSYVSSPQADIMPAANKAVLTFSDGRTVQLSSDQQGVVVGDELVYLDGSQVLPADMVVSPDAATLLSITTPRGGVYQVTLPDGSSVHLNAGSTLTYPSRFAENERVVELEGEAYFHVKAAYEGTENSRIPFRVKSGAQRIEVLGTEFNLAAYPDDPEIRTTLLTGRIRVASEQAQTTLAPGQQSVHSKAGLLVNEVDVEHATAWKNGKFSFTGKSFPQIMQEIERWYDIEIEYEGGIPPNRFYGDAKRSDNLSIVLRLLETGGVEYRLEGRTLFIVNKSH